eukprot:gene5627-6323_t
MMMMESTPLMSPATSARRKRGQLVSHRTPTDLRLNVNDDAEERRQRRRSLLLSNNLLSPIAGHGTPTGGSRRGSGVATDLERTNIGMTYAQLSEHNANCVKLSSENKINSKNAFALHLIDYMKYLVTRSQKEDNTTNFQAVSCTLDAGVKIYAGRVDSVHSDAYKMLGSLGRAAEVQSGDEDNAASDEAKQEKAQKKKANKGPCKTIQKNIKAINCDKLDLTFEVDPFFHKTSATFDEGGTKGLLLNHLLIKDESYELMLDSRKEVKSADDEDVINNNKSVSVNLHAFKDISSKIAEEDVQLCPQLANFRFTEWDRDAEDLINEQAQKSFSEAQEHRFDMDASALEVDMDVGDNDGGYSSDDADPGGAFGDNFGDGSESGEGSRDAFPATERGAMPDGRPMQLEFFLQPNEYSYFRQDILDTWAGPRHWKVKARSKDPAWDGVQDVDKNKKKRQKKAAFVFDYDANIEDISSPGKAAKTLAKSTLDKMSALVTTLPDDLRYDVETFTRLFCIPTLRLKRQLRPAGSDENDNCEYNYDNDYDRENFCPELQDNNNDDDDDDVEPMDISNNATPGGFDVTAGENSFFGGDNLVSQPNKVEKIQIAYAKTAKRIDIKKLKKTLWESLTVEETNKQQQEEAEKSIAMEERPLVKQLEDRKMTDIQSFKDIYKNLPDKMSEHASKNLSVPIAFVCLLYLANEKELKLIGSEGMDDIQITKEIPKSFAGP